MAEKKQLNLSVSPDVLKTLERLAKQYGRTSRNAAGAEALEKLLPVYEKLLQKEHGWIAELIEATDEPKVIEDRAVKRNVAPLLKKTGTDNR